MVRAAVRPRPDARHRGADRYADDADRASAWRIGRGRDNVEMTYPAEVSQAAENAGNVVLRPTDQSVVDWADRARLALCAAAAVGYPPYVERLSIHLDLLADDAAAVVLDRGRWAELSETARALLACACDPEETGLEPERLVIAAQVAGFTGFQARLSLGRDLAAHVVHSGASSARFTVGGLPTADETFPERRWVAPPVSPPPELREATATLLPEADRELVALAVSVVAGCEHGVSEHGRRHVRLSGDETTAVALATKGPGAVPGPRDRAIAQAATELARTPCALAERDVSPLNSEDVHGVVAVAALSTWETRLRTTLGRAGHP